MTAAVATLLLTLVSTAGVYFPLRNRGGDAPSLAPLLAAVVLWSVGLVLGMEVLSQFHALGRPGLIGLAVAIPALMFLLTRRQPPLPRTSSWEAWPVAIPLALLLGGIGVLCFPWLGYGLTQPVRPVSDAPIYHLPFILRWREAGWLEPMPTPFGELGATYFPANGDLWLAWLAILDGDDSLARVGGWPWLFVAAIALAAIGRRLGGDRASACVPPAFWLTMPFVQFTSSLGLVDIPFAAWYLCGLYFLIDSWKRPSADRFPSLLLSALALGLAAGTKTIGIVVGFPLLLLLLWLARSGVVRFVATFAAFLLPCSFWYLRNCLYGGNPLYPLHVDLFGITLFPGWYDGAAMVETSSYHVPYFDFANFRAVFALVFDPRLVWLWPAVPALALILGIFHRPARPAAALGLLAALYFALFWFVIPYNTQQRFLLPALGIALLPLGLLRGRWSLASGVLLMIALAAAIEGRNFTPPLETLWIAGLFCHLSIAALLLLRLRAQWGLILAALVAIVFVAKELRAPRPSLYPVDGFAARMQPVWEALERATAGRTASVAYAGTNLPYYLMGESHRHRVRYVNIVGPAEWLPHDFHRARLAAGAFTPGPTAFPEFHREGANFADWSRNLQNMGVEFLFVARENYHGHRRVPAGPPDFPIEFRWLSEHPDEFEEVFRGPPVDERGPWAVLFRRKAASPTTPSP